MSTSSRYDFFPNQKLKAQAKLKEAEEMYRISLHIREQLDPEHPDVARSLHELAELLLRTGRYNEAEYMNARALQLRQVSYLSVIHCL
jgi:hypothetical protein